MFVLQAGFNKYKETQGGEINAKLYNEMVVYKILDVSMTFDYFSSPFLLTAEVHHLYTNLGKVKQDKPYN